MLRKEISEVTQVNNNLQNKEVSVDMTEKIEIVTANNDNENQISIKTVSEVKDITDPNDIYLEEIRS